MLTAEQRVHVAVVIVIWLVVTTRCVLVDCGQFLERILRDRCGIWKILSCCCHCGGIRVVVGVVGHCVSVVVDGVVG